MSSINFHTKEISAKIVYYGPGLCGKTTSLQRIYQAIPEERRPQIVSLATEVDRTIFFDFLPVTAYRIRDFTVRLQLYTVPGQVFYNATRKLVLNGVDGVVFVVDSQRAMKDSNLESLQNLSENLSELGLEVPQVPLVMQYNKRDLDDIYSYEDMQRLYNHRQVPAFATIATQGDGLFDALKAISQVVVNDLVRKGLGKQLRAQGPGDGPERKAISVGPPSQAAQEPGAGGSMAEAVSQAAATASAPAASYPVVASLPFWPAEEHARAGTAILAALANERWGESVDLMHQLLSNVAKQWAQSQGIAGGDVLTSFLLQRNVSGARYGVFMRALSARAEHRPVRQVEAMNGFVLVLETLW